MISTPITLLLLCFYLVLTIVCLVEHKLTMAAYWFGALILNIAVFQMSLK